MNNLQTRKSAEDILKIIDAAYVAAKTIVGACVSIYNFVKICSNNNSNN